MTAIAQALSAALLHFLWQGALVACLLWIALSMLRSRSANARYITSCAALALMAALPAITAWMLYRQSAGIAISSAISTGTTAAVYAARFARQAPPLAWITLWRQWTLPVWSLGVFIFALRLVLSCRHVAALRRLGHAAEGQLAEAVSLLARRMEASRAIRVLISTVAESPSVVGWLRPVILLPAATLAGLEPEQLQAVLAHEIAHIRRHDYLVNLAQTIVETLLFYHPAVWWASARIRHERELCCDDAAVAACGDAIAYARALTSLERLRVTAPQLAVGSTGGSLLYRIQRLAGLKPELRPSKLPGVLALALGLACFAMTVHWAKAQQMTQQRMPEEWGISVLSTGQVLHRERVPYPEATYKNGIHGTVTLEVTLDQSGSVADAHVLSGPPELRKTALQSVLQWQFANGRAGETQQVSIAFQQDARARAQQRSDDRLTQASLTESFLKDELKAAQERGDSPATEDINKKLAAAKSAELLAQATDQHDSFLLQSQVLEMTRQLEDARKTLAETNPETAALQRQIEALNEQIAQIKQANQGKLPDRADLSETDRQMELVYAELQQRLADTMQSYGEQNYQVKQLKAQIAAIQNQMGAASASLAGWPLAIISITGVPVARRNELAERITAKVGDILSQESIDRALAAIRQFDPRLRCRFLRAGGQVALRITGPAQPQ